MFDGSASDRPCWKSPARIIHNTFAVVCCLSNFRGFRMKRIICVFVLLASCLGASAETNLERVLNCEVSYTILNGYKVEQKVRITLPEGKRDLAVWLVERKKGGVQKTGLPHRRRGGASHLAALQQGGIRHLSLHTHLAVLRPLSPHRVFPVQKVLAHRRRARGERQEGDRDLPRLSGPHRHQARARGVREVGGDPRA